jgi:hypothetical protein
VETQNAVHKPQSVVTAVNLLWAVLALELVKTPMHYFHLSATGPAMLTKNYVPLAMAGLIILAFLIFTISSGKNWARITLLVMVVRTLFGVSGILDQFSWSPVHGIISVAQVGLLVYAVFLLFTKPGSVWFRKVTAT